MNRSRRRWLIRCLSVPRACGDEPTVGIIAEDVQECSPRLRG